ncbi:hypothetical protein [Pyrobaculum sp.]|uniref:hypothetical protein n=1 Tax=Pyrobaculum sp. TaxID=2004705 RepID=UPI003D0FBAEA
MYQISAEVAIAATRPEFAPVRESVYSRFLEKCVGDVEARREVYERAIKPALSRCLDTVGQPGEGVCAEITHCLKAEARKEIASWFEAGAVPLDKYYVYKAAVSNIFKCVEASHPTCDMHVLYEVAVRLGPQYMEALAKLLRQI